MKRSVRVLEFVCLFILFIRYLLGIKYFLYNFFCKGMKLMGFFKVIYIEIFSLKINLKNFSY